MKHAGSHGPIARCNKGQPFAGAPAVEVIGDQGGGFAVVASEVRSLAQRSSQAAREIKALVTTSVDKEEAGARIVRGAGETMQELVCNARRMNDVLAEVSSAALEQSKGVSQASGGRRTRPDAARSCQHQH